MPPAYFADQANKPKLRARSKVKRAVKSGRLVRQPCEKCGADKSHAHHHDYSKPLDVQWLCPPCHGEVHRPSHCKRGHALMNTNVYIDRTRGQRSCLQCRKDYRREYWKIHKRSEWKDSRRN